MAQHNCSILRNVCQQAVLFAQRDRCVIVCDVGLTVGVLAGGLSSTCALRHGAFAKDTLIHKANRKGKRHNSRKRQYRGEHIRFGRNKHCNDVNERVGKLFLRHSAFYAKLLQFFTVFHFILLARRFVACASIIQSRNFACKHRAVANCCVFVPFYIKMTKK